MNPPLPSLKALAHLGDAVYDLWIREEAVKLYQKSKDLHKYTTERVKAETQCKIIEKLLPTLPEEIAAMVKRAQNMPVTSKRRSEHSQYRKATSLEVLIGYWYLAEPENISSHREQILQLVNENACQNSIPK